MVCGTGVRRRISRRVERSRERRPISRVDRLFAPRNSNNPERLFAPRSGRTGFLNGVAHRSSRRSSTVARRGIDAHRRGQFVSLSLVRTGGPLHRFSTTDLDGGQRHRFSTTDLDGGQRHRFSTTELDGGPRQRFSTTELDDGLRHGCSTMDLEGCRTKSRPAADFPRGPPVRAAKLQKPGAPVRTAKRTNWLLERGRGPMSSTITDEASSSRYRSFERAVRFTGSRRRNSTGVNGAGS
jgi:hypothetical protein